MKVNNSSFVLKKEISISSSLLQEIKPLTSPFINIFEDDSFLNVNILFYELKRRDVYIDYINNFLILKLSFYTFPTEISTLKRIFYYKNLDFYNYVSEKKSDMIFLKIPFNF